MKWKKLLIKIALYFSSYYSQSRSHLLVQLIMLHRTCRTHTSAISNTERERFLIILQVAALQLGSSSKVLHGFQYALSRIFCVSKSCGIWRRKLTLTHRTQMKLSLKSTSIILYILNSICITVLCTANISPNVFAAITRSLISTFGGYDDVLRRYVTSVTDVVKQRDWFWRNYSS